MATTETQTQQYEGAILAQLIKNAERLAVVERDIGQLKTDLATVATDVAVLKSDMTELKLRVQNMEASLAWIKWLMGTIALGVLVNIFSQPILTALHWV